MTDHKYACINDSLEHPIQHFKYEDFTPEFHIGRIPVSSKHQADVVVDKIIQYEKNPVDDDNFYESCLYCGEFTEDSQRQGYENYVYGFIGDMEYIFESIWDYTSIRDRNRVYALANSESVPEYLSNGILVDATMEFYDSWDMLETRISNYINSGAYYVLYNGHGLKDNWSNPNYSKSDINNLNNGEKLPIVFSMACLTGKYNNGTCFAEQFLQKENGGCAAIIAASDVAYSFYARPFLRSLFNTLWPESYLVANQYNTRVAKYELGDLLDEAKLTVIGEWKKRVTDPKVAYSLEIFHCFGDPSMQFCTEKPTPFEEVFIDKSDDGIEVFLGNDMGRITFVDKSNGNVVSTYDSHAVYLSNPHDVAVCISGHNKIPYILKEDIYIQNENISEPATYDGDNIMIGSNVTNTKPAGPVTISNGKTTITGNKIEVRGVFSVQKGAELELRNQ